MITTTTEITVNNYPGVVSKIFGEILPPIEQIETNDICYCKYECDYVEKAFAEVGGEWWKNDKKEFLFQRIVEADTIALELYKNNVKIADITDNTYGEYYSTFVDAPLYRYFIIYWENVYNLHGAGLYKIKAQKNIIGTVSEFESHNFRLMPYSDELADKTVRIETYQTGNILSSSFNYSLMLNELPNGKYSSYRISGKFGWKTPKLEVDSYLNTDYRLRQNTDQIITEWQLETNMLPSNVSNQLMYDDLLSNKFLITDYNIMNNEIYRRVDVYPDDIGDVKHYPNNRNTRYLIKFVDKKQNTIKHNF